MTTHPRITTAALTLGLLAVCGLPASASAPATSANSGSVSPSTQQGSSDRFDRKVDLASRALNLQPEDAQTMRQAVASPLRFTQQAGDREFRGELIVHAKAEKVTNARSRVNPSLRKASQFVDEYVVAVPAGLSEGELAAMLMATGDYEFVEPNWTLFPLNTPNDSQFSSSWQHNRLQSTSAWNLHTGESDIIVAVCDSGVDTNHPDLQAALVSGYNAVDNLAQSSGGQVEDVNGHGTFVSGCAAAQGNNGTGVVGVGWDFSIMPIRVSNNSGGTASGFDILEGARWAVQHGAQVINASFSGGTSTGNQTTAKYIIDRGGLLFWSSGNDNSLVTYDGPDLVVVGSTTSSDNKSGFSNYGPGVDIAAPGSSVRSTTRGGGYGSGSGTSYASPIAAGVGAMIFSVRSDLSGQDVQDILYRSVDDLGAPGRDDSFGRGRVNTLNAIQVAQAYQPRIGLPVAESFDSSSWMDLLEVTSGSVSTGPDAESSGGGSVLILDNSDQVTTGPLGGRTLPIGIPALSYTIKSTGVEAGEGYEIEMLNPDDTWTSVFQFTSTGEDTDGFLHVMIPMSTSFLWHGVKLRFTADGSDASDQWMIDDLNIGTLPDPTPVAPFVESFESGAISGMLWDVIDGPTVEISNSTHAARFVGVQKAETITIPMTQFGVAPNYVRFNAWAAGGAGTDDVLKVWTRDVAGNWLSVGTIDGQTLGETPTMFEFQSPLSAWFNDVLQVRFSTVGDDPIFVDEIYVGPDQFVAACSVADTQEPLGELDFLDISAFLNAFNNGLPAGDLNGDTQFDFLDISIFINAYNQGCP